MAKMCMTERELKRRNMVEKFKAKRAALNEIISDIKFTPQFKSS
jgi:small subunit ribosomal protein S14